MRLHKGDAVEVADNDGVRRVKIVVRIEPSAGRVRLAGQTKAATFKSATTTATIRFAGTSRRFRSEERGCVAVRVDETGVLRRRRANA